MFKKRGAKVHNFRVGDVVLIEQKKLRKDMCRFESKSLVVTAVKGSMISFDDNGKSFSRHASFFKFKTASTSAFKSKESVGDFSDLENEFKKWKLYIMTFLMHNFTRIQNLALFF